MWNATTMTHADHPARIRLALGFGALVVGSLTARAEAPGAAPTPVVAQDEARVQWTATPLTITTGEEARLVIDLHLPEGLHVFQDDIHLTIVDAGGLHLGAPVLPATTSPSTDAEVRWYEEDVHIELPVTSTDVALGVHLVQIEGEVRGCSARRCHAGTREALEVYVQVVDRDEAACPR